MALTRQNLLCGLFSMSLYCQLAGLLANLLVCILHDTPVSVCMYQDLMPISVWWESLIDLWSVTATSQAREGGNMTAVTTKTQNVHGDDLIVTTTSPYEAEVFASRADWRVRHFRITECILFHAALLGF